MSKYDKHIAWAKTEFQKLETSKQKIITTLAEKLEDDGMKVDEISAYISEKLSEDGFTTKRYVREVLSKIEDGEKYKEKKKDTSKQTVEPEPKQKQVMGIATTGETINQNPSQSAALTPQNTATPPAEVSEDMSEVQGEEDIQDDDGPSVEEIVNTAVNKVRAELMMEIKGKEEEIAKKDKQIQEMEKELNEEEEEEEETGYILIEPDEHIGKLKTAVRLWQEKRAPKYYIVHFERRGRDLYCTKITKSEK